VHRSEAHLHAKAPCELLAGRTPTSPKSSQDASTTQSQNSAKGPAWPNLDSLVASFGSVVDLLGGEHAPTRLEPAFGLDPAREILLKREDEGPNGAFKWRGALAACAELQGQGAAGVVVASTGNHGAAVAWAAGRLGLKAQVVVPGMLRP
jgi:threonine synthase